MGLLKARNLAAADQAAPAPARLDAADPMERRRAVQQVAGAPGAVAALVALLRREPENVVRQAAFIALAGLQSEPAAAGLAELLSDADPALRNGALEALVAMPAQSRDLLAPLGECEDPDVRIFAVLLAAELPAEDTAEWLLALARREADANVCSNLAEVLGASGQAAALPALADIVARFPDEPYLAFAAETAMARIREA